MPLDPSLSTGTEKKKNDWWQKACRPLPEDLQEELTMRPINDELTCSAMRDFFLLIQEGEWDKYKNEGGKLNSHNLILMQRFYRHGNKSINRHLHVPASESSRSLHDFVKNVRFPGLIIDQSMKAEDKRGRKRHRPVMLDFSYNASANEDKACSQMMLSEPNTDEIAEDAIIRPDEIQIEDENDESDNMTWRESYAA